MKTPFEPALIQEMIEELSALRTDILQVENIYFSRPRRICSEYLASAKNLVHYLALRRHDIRKLQFRLSECGISSLGRSESHVLDNIDHSLYILHKLVGMETPLPEGANFTSQQRGATILRERTNDLLGNLPDDQQVRFMVTAATEMAQDPSLIRELIASGMDCLRINCAANNSELWGKMIHQVRSAEKTLGKRCLVLMDLGGPKFRTGPLEEGPRVVKFQPERDLFGRVTKPARICLVPADLCPSDTQKMFPIVPVPIPTDFFQRLKKGDELTLRDTRDKKRFLKIVEKEGDRAWAEGDQTIYLQPGIVFTLKGKNKTDSKDTVPVGNLPPLEQSIFLNKGDLLVLTQKQKLGRPAILDEEGKIKSPAIISGIPPELVAYLQPGERIWFDDGKLGGVIHSCKPEEVIVQITRVKEGGDRLRAGKGINLPDSKIPSLPINPKDLEDLQFIVQHADLVGLSFIHKPKDIREFYKLLKRFKAEHLGVILKIETARAFRYLPDIILTAMRRKPFGVMIARGDLAIEYGFERLAEIQEEILWICEASHIPVIWGTQVLEGLIKRGMPSRAEVTDVAHGGRAECIMLNKGPYLKEALGLLQLILARMKAHQSKKISLLSKLRWWAHVERH